MKEKEDSKVSPSQNDGDDDDEVVIDVENSKRDSLLEAISDKYHNEGKNQKSLSPIDKVKQTDVGLPQLQSNAKTFGHDDVKAKGKSIVDISGDEGMEPAVRMTSIPSSTGTPTPDPPSLHEQIRRSYIRPTPGAFHIGGNDPVPDGMSSEVRQREDC